MPEILDNLARGRRVFITGTAGFIGFHLAQNLLDHGFIVHGFDGMTDYYDVALKRRRHQLLLAHDNFRATEALLEDRTALNLALQTSQADIVIHLAAQAGVRYSLEHPESYFNSNISGSFNLLEAVREVGCEHLMMASTSSIYGGNQRLPFSESHAAAHPLSFYAATKLADENMAHSYAHLHQIPTSMMRFYTVYGPWGRPDLALFKFVSAIVEGREINIFNQGKMARDFTYVSDLVRAITLLINVPPKVIGQRQNEADQKGCSPVAPWRAVNIGNGVPVELMDFVAAIEKGLGKQATYNFSPMQPGDVRRTWADITLLQELTGYQPEMQLADGVAKFIQWFKKYHDISG